MIHQNADLDPTESRATQSCGSNLTSWDVDDLEDFMPMQASQHIRSCQPQDVRSYILQVMLGSYINYTCVTVQ